MFSIAKIAKNRKIYECKLCDYTTFNSYDIKKHNDTIKHKINGSSTSDGDLAIPIEKSQKKYKCYNCCKTYRDNSGLWRHKKICTNVNFDINENKVLNEENTLDSVTSDNSENDNDSLDIDLNIDEYDADNNAIIKPHIDMNASDKELIIMLIKQNAELIDIVKNTSFNNTMINNTNNGVNNSHNKTFNLNVFLNEYCKDAMNIMDFVDSLQLQLSDLENVGKLGYVEGISNIIVKNLKALDVCKRPVHCSDSKREVIYVKDNDKWERENEDKYRIRKAIKYIAHKNTKLIIDFREKYPDCNKSHSKYAEQYNKLVVEAMGGFGDNDLEKENKIIKNIAKEVTIDKKQNYIE